MKEHYIVNKAYQLLCYIVMVVGVLSACNNQSELLDYALKTAGENRSELEAVLDHFSESKDDTLKLSAAKFLIENMPFHFSYYGAKVDSMNEIFELLARLKYLQSEVTETDRVAAVDSIKKRIRRYHLNDSIVPDNMVLKSEYLINNIEEAFRAWETAPWREKVNFRMFCEYILPYRIRKERPEYWRNYLRTKFAAEKESIQGSTDIDSLFNDYIKYYYKVTGSKVEKEYGYDMNFSQLDISLAGECLDRCAYQIYYNRAVGIPATFDYVPNWGNRPFALHAMVGNAVQPKQLAELISNENKPIEKNNRISDASPRPTAYIFTEDEMSQGLYVQYVKTLPKVYRSTWSANPDILDIYRNIPSDQIYSNLVKPTIIDVSEEYLDTSCVEISLPKKYKDFKLAYLSVFQPSGWCPVAFSRSDSDGELQFNAIGKDIVYLPVVYTKRRLEPIGQPFYIDQQGEVHKITVEKNHKQKMHLIRKFPFFAYTGNHSYWFWGIYFEGANKQDFSDAKLLHKVDYYPFYMTKAKVNSQQKYRYLRCCPAKRGKLHVAEVTYWGVNGNDTVQLKGKPYARFSKEEMIDKGFDGDILSYYQSYHRDESLCYDLGEGNATQIIEIDFAPRNDANCIIPGNHYQLYYWANKWKLIDEKKATDYSINFENIPVNGLYWLKCFEGGKEERIFTYEDGMQIWW